MEAKIGDFIQRKATGETFKIVSTGAMFGYDGLNGTGQIRSDQLEVEFNLLNDPSTQDEIEALLLAKYNHGEASTGLFQTDLSYVVMDNVDGQITFTWFHEATKVRDMVEEA